jgi:hypothetical protein
MIKNISILFCIAFLITSCKKNQPLLTEDAKDYFPLQVGKQITYQVDSTNYIGYTVTPTITKYFAKDSITNVIKDNLGRDSYRVNRYIKSNLAHQWQPSSSYYITPLEKSIEVVENNLRVIKLMNPVTSTFTWKGNSYLESQGPNSNIAFMYDWEFLYDSIKAQRSYNNLVFPETITVTQVDTEDGTFSNPLGYSEKNYSKEVYARNVGLIYKDFLHWSYQPPNGSTPGYRSGYGIRLSIIDKN